MREAILNSVNKDAKPFCMVILCHSFIRCQEMSDTIAELITFCDDMLEVVNLDSTDFTESQIKIKKSMQNSESLKSRVLVMTPSIALKL